MESQEVLGGEGRGGEGRGGGGGGEVEKSGGMDRGRMVNIQLCDGVTMMVYSHLCPYLTLLQCVGIRILSLLVEPKPLTLLGLDHRIVLKHHQDNVGQVGEAILVVKVELLWRQK